ncbi:MAG: mitochondrial fission ELM1 family protein [Planctomycetes bacterium]|nr:mitochondrial fission ELM1 family protein [Planctomycetota bacterium]
MKNKDVEKGLILVGGESSHYLWDDARVANQIKEVVHQNSQVQWTLTTSRRTPETFVALLQGTQVNIVPFAETDSVWLREHYYSSGQIWVTPDSVSMVYEALSSGAMTFVFTLEKTGKKSRVRNGLAELLENGAVMQYETWKEKPTSQHKPREFDESSRVASIILERVA